MKPETKTEETSVRTAEAKPSCAPAPCSAANIIIPERPPPGIVEALNNFVRAIYAYEETGVWPDNGTLRRLAEEGKEALGHRYSANEMKTPNDQAHLPPN